MPGAARSTTTNARRHANLNTQSLLPLQAQFEASAGQGDGRAAAKVTRISRRPAAAAAAAGATAGAPPAAPLAGHQQGCSVHGPGCQGHHPQAAAAAEPQQMAGLMAAMQAAMKGIVGEVQERPVAAAAEPPKPPTAPAAAPGSFPQATHRRLSKFALGRQRQSGAPATAAPAAAEAAPAPAAAPAVLAAAAGGQPQDDESRIDAENRQLLAAMTPEQIAEAREEVLQRLPPAAAEFLRRRGASRAAAPSAADSGSASGSGSGTAATVPAGRQQRAAPGGATRVAASSRRAQSARQQQQPPDAASVPPAAQLSVAARLRFAVDGSVVGLRPAESTADVAPAEVAERDPLRCDSTAHLAAATDPTIYTCTPVVGLPCFCYSSCAAALWLQAGIRGSG